MTPPDLADRVASLLAPLGPLDDALGHAVREAVANAVEHGTPPVQVERHGEGGDPEVVVRDAGAGPAGPPALAAVDAERGRGRWLAHHLADTSERRVRDGFEVRLRARRGCCDAAG